MAYETAARTVVDPNPQPIRIVITPGYPPKVEPDSVTLHLSRDEELQWECGDTSGKKPFKVIFKAESPFTDRTFHNDSPCSGRPRPDVKPDGTKRYPYTVIAGGTLDPEVIVNY